jgi:hypothetical protein
MSEKATPDDDKKREQPSQQPLPPVESSEALSETDLDGMAGGWSLITPTWAQGT